MPGTAKTNNFMLGTATVMIGAQDDLFDLTPADHSIGLVKNFTLSGEPSYTELTQGVKNTIVYSTLTQNPVRASMEAYEYTAQNIAYGLGLSADKAPISVSSTVDGEVAAASPAATSFDVQTGDGSNFAQGDYIMIKLDTDDNFLIRKVSSISTDTITVDQGFNVTIPDTAAVIKVHSLGAGNKDDQPFYADKVTGKLADGTAVAMLLPKIRVTNGFSMQFSSEDYANMPLELTIYDLVNTDTFYSWFNGDAARLFRP